MPFKRMIPCLLLKNGLLVRSQLFSVHQAIGNPVSTIRRFADWNVDELILLDISKDNYHDLRRDDMYLRYQGTTMLDILQLISRECFMPLAVGGRIASLEDMQQRLSAGADKCIINTQALEYPEFITQAAQKFGNQCVVISIDVKQRTDGQYEVYSHDGKHPTGLSPVQWAQQAQQLGAGELFLNSIDRDGSGMGYDVALIQQVVQAVSIPVIACGGVGRYEDFIPGAREGGAAAISAANIFHFFENSYLFAKEHCLQAGVDMRPLSFENSRLQRIPHYTEHDRARVVERILLSTQPVQSAQTEPRPKAVQWCTRCVYPGISAAPMEFDGQGVCMGCRMSEVKRATPDTEWVRRKDVLYKILNSYKCTDGTRHDCVIAVSGGKDSWYQTHVIKNEFGFNPLLVTYNGNNYTDAGWRNLLRMKDVFNVDHIIYSPSIELLKKLNRLAMLAMGDMNWHAHVGITTVPVRTAVQQRIPLVIWGEHGYLDLCGQFSLDDFPEMSYRDRLEHFARGFEWNYFVGMEGITSADMSAWQYPADRQLFELDVRGIYLGNYIKWEANDHTQMMIDRYGFEVSPTAFDRTYRRMSNLDDMHENGIHDYLKFIKFGYGRCTDHVCKDIRADLMTREQGIALIRQYDHVKPSDLQRWLQYTGWTENMFDRVADTFRDKRVWHMEQGQWKKDNLWD